MTTKHRKYTFYIRTWTNRNYIHLYPLHFAHSFSQTHWIKIAQGELCCFLVLNPIELSIIFVIVVWFAIKRLIGQRYIEILEDELFIHVSWPIMRHWQFIFTHTCYIYRMCFIDNKPAASLLAWYDLLQQQYLYDFVIYGSIYGLIMPDSMPPPCHALYTGSVIQCENFQTHP